MGSIWPVFKVTLHGRFWVTPEVDVLGSLYLAYDLLVDSTARYDCLPVLSRTR